MRLTIAAVGRLGAGPERALVEEYAARATAAGRALALGPLGVIEIDERKARDPAAQSASLIGAVSPSAVMIALDERGSALSSAAFARAISGWRDAGRVEAAFLIGGADGHAPDLRQRAERVIALGPMVWPHRLVRVMLAEQIYRAVSILAGTPYHRG